MRSSRTLICSRLRGDFHFVWMALVFAILGAILVLTPRPSHSLASSFHETTARAFAALERLEAAATPQASGTALVDLLEAGRDADRIATAASAGDDDCLARQAIALSDLIAGLKVNLIANNNTLPADFSASSAALREDIRRACDS